MDCTIRIVQLASGGSCTPVGRSLSAVLDNLCMLRASGERTEAGHSLALSKLGMVRDIRAVIQRQVVPAYEVAVLGADLLSPTYS